MAALVPGHGGREAHVLEVPRRRHAHRHEVLARGVSRNVGHLRRIEVGDVLRALGNRVASVARLDNGAKQLPENIVALRVPRHGADRPDERVAAAVDGRLYALRQADPPARPQALQVVVDLRAALQDVRREAVVVRQAGQLVGALVGREPGHLGVAEAWYVRVEHRRVPATRPGLCHRGLVLRRLLRPGPLLGAGRREAVQLELLARGEPRLQGHEQPHRPDDRVHLVHLRGPEALAVRHVPRAALRVAHAAELDVEPLAEGLEARLRAQQRQPHAHLRAKARAQVARARGEEPEGALPGELVGVLVEARQQLALR
mmetsp:Transcript_75027/g.212029  ORF Transcript_75027/g.212029 Transcript_75027/m.212029 type:complete len:316 (+) Transcript_75027:781-1728(+)